MPSPDDWIDLDPQLLSDRELLLLTVKGVNLSYKKICEQDTRIRKLEDWRNVLFGGLALVMVLLSSKELLEILKVALGRP